VCIILKGDYNMTTKQIIETQLDCRATAALNESVLADLSKPDLPIANLLNVKEDDTDESKDEQSASD
jgi:hypothetical protein